MKANGGNESKDSLLWAMPEEQAVAIQIWGVNPPEGNSLVDPSHLGKAKGL